MRHRQELAGSPKGTIRSDHVCQGAIPWKGLHNELHESRHLGDARWQTGLEKFLLNDLKNPEAASKAGCGMKEE